MKDIISKKNTEAEFQESLTDYQQDLEYNMHTYENWKPNQIGFKFNSVVRNVVEYLRERKVGLIILGLCSAIATLSFSSFK